MILNLPKIGLVRFKDDLSEEEMDSQLERLSKKYDFEIPRGQLTTGEMLKKSAVRGAKQLGSTFGDIIPAMGASALGFDEYAAKQMEEAKATKNEIDKYYAPQYRDTGDIKGIGDIPGFALETIAEQVPNIATSLIPGGIGGTLARRAGVAAAERAAMPLIESGATAAELARVAGRKGAEYASRGQNAGVFLGSYAQNAPEIFQNIYNETGEMAPGAAMLFGTAAAALDSVLPAQLLKSVTGPVKVGIVEKLLERSGMDKGLLRSVTAGMLKGSGSESLTEGMQEAISIAAENFVNKHESVFGSKEWNRIMESSVRGAVAGGAFGAAGGVPQGIRDRYKNEIKEATKVAQDTQQPVPLQIGYDPRVGKGLPEVIYVHADGSTSFVSELSDAAFAEKYAASPVNGTPVEDAKTRANRERLEKQRYDAEVKEAQAKVKAGIAELIDTPTDLVGLAKQKSPLQQTIAQARGDLDILAGKRGPKAEAIPEPKVVQRAAPLTPQQLPTTINDEVLKGLGIGHTALLRKNKLLDGKDISNPADAAEVRRILEAYAENRSEPVRQKIEAYLSRPEFQGAPNVAGLNAKPSRGGASVDSEPNLVNTTGTNAGLKPDGNVFVEPNVRDVNAREEQPAPAIVEEGTPSGIETIETQQATQEGQAQPIAGKPLGKKASADKIKAEQGEQEALRGKTKFIRDNDNNADSVLRDRLLTVARDLGIAPKDVPVETYRGSEAHNALRLPALLNEHLRLQGVIRTSQEANQKAKNAKELEAIEEAITQAGGNAKEMLGFLRGLNQDQRDAAISQLSRHAFNEFDKVAKQKMQALKDQIQKGAFAKTEVSEEDIYDALAGKINESKLGKAFGELGKKLFLPTAIGPTLDADGRAIAEKGNFKDLLSHIINKTDNKLVRQILRKIQSLGINPKIVIGDVGRDNHAGVYDPDTNTITLDPDFGLNHHTIIHETVHAAISHVLRSPNNKLTQAFVKFFEQIKNQMGAAYGGQDIQEFASELVGNPEFQALLKTIKAPRSENMFVNIMQAIGEFLGFRSAYTEGMKFVNDAIDISSKVEVTPANKMFLSMGSAVNSAFNTVGQIGQNMPSLAGKTLEDTKNLFSNVKDFGWMKTAMGLLRLDNINTLYGKELPSIQKLLDALELRNGMQEQRISTINENYKEFTKIAQAHKQDMDRMNDMAIDARLYEVDPLDASFKTTPANAAQYNRLRNIYTSLDPKVQKVYEKIRNFYMKSLDEYEALLVGDPKKGIPGMLSPTLAAKLAVEFATRKRLAAYVPFLRNGDFWLEFPDPASGERTAMAFESIRERQQFIDSQLTPNKIPSKSYRNLQSITFDPKSVLPTSFIGKLMTDLRAANATQEQLDAVYQAHLMFFPAESIAKQFLKSKNVLGMERDIVKGYGTTAIKWARKLTNSEYAPKIDTALDEIKEQANNVNRLDVTAAAENILEQKEFLHNPTFNSFTQAATTLSYFEFIAGNISSALVNITSLPMLVWPTLGGKFGFDKASSAMMNASKIAINGMQNDSRYTKLYKTMMDHGQLEHTMAREVLEGRRQSTGEFTGLKGRILDGLSIPFAATERYNRATTAIAAYDLARENGMSQDAAIQYAINTTKDIHTSGLAATAPKWMQHPIGRVFFTFKSFTWNSAFVMARAFHQAFKGETPAIQHAARRQLLGTYGMVMAFGGVKGMPFYGATSAFFTMLAALFGDDDEPFDFDEELRDFFGELGYKGAFNYVTNIELANRVGIATDLIYRDDPRGISEHGYVLSAMQQMFGPAGSYAVSVGNGVKMMKEGHVERGIEAMVPSFVRNGMKGLRYMSEGALTLKGDPVDEDINAYNSLMQVIGFSPADLSSNYEKTSAAKSYEKEVGARRVRLLNLHDMAKTAGDMDLLSETKDAISEFNDKHPKDKITGDTLRRSESSRKAAEKNMINGVTFNKKLRGEIEEKFFED